MKTFIEYEVTKIHEEIVSVWVLQDSEEDLRNEVRKLIDNNRQGWFDYTEGELSSHFRTPKYERNMKISERNLEDLLYFDIVQELINKDKPYLSDSWATYTFIEDLLEDVIKVNREQEKLEEFEKKQLKLEL